MIANRREFLLGAVSQHEYGSLRISVKLTQGSKYLWCQPGNGAGAARVRKVKANVTRSRENIQ